ncbi:MAG: aminoacyl-tRNA hydrolase [Dehalococcoidia bacterium]
MVFLGLGNPGRSYARSRHNVGYWCIDGLTRKYGIHLKQRRRHAAVGEGYIEGVAATLARSRTYMNHSGAAARYLLDRYHLPPEELLVVHDDMDLPLGKLRLRPSGGSAGHNGIASIITALGTQSFPRVRIGVGHPEGQDTVPFVLGPFASEEAKVIAEAIDQAVEAVAHVAQFGLEAAMNKYN